MRSKLEIIFVLIILQISLPALTQEIGDWHVGINYGVQSTNSKYINQNVLPEIAIKSLYFDRTFLSNISLGLYTFNYTPYFYYSGYKYSIQGKNYGIKLTYWIPFENLYNYATFQYGKNDFFIGVAYAANGSDQITGENKGFYSVGYGIATKKLPFKLMAEVGYNSLSSGDLTLDSTKTKLAALNLSGTYYKLGIIFKFSESSSAKASDLTLL